jgi:hypothetical protein
MGEWSEKNSTIYRGCPSEKTSSLGLKAMSETINYQHSAQCRCWLHVKIDDFNIVLCSVYFDDISVCIYFADFETFFHRNATHPPQSDLFGMDCDCSPNVLTTFRF